jgi:hypothetical protein
MNKTLRGCLAVFGGMLVLCVNGGFNLFGSISAYAVSYYRDKNVPTTIAFLMLYLLVRAIVSTCLFPLGPFLQANLSTRMYSDFDRCVD